MNIVVYLHNPIYEQNVKGDIFEYDRVDIHVQGVQVPMKWYKQQRMPISVTVALIQSPILVAA